MNELTREAIDGYAANAHDLIPRYSALDSRELYADVFDLFPKPPARVLDVGAGPGRDSEWLLRLGYDVTAVEPVSAFRQTLVEIAPACMSVDARLPDLVGVTGQYDLILVSGVWQHVAQRHRSDAWARLYELLIPEGCLVVSLRHGPGAIGIPVAEIDPNAEISLATEQGLTVLRRRAAGSVQHHNITSGVTWTWLAFCKARRR